MTRALMIVLSTLLLTALAPPHALAQDWQWLDLDGAAPGTPPTVVLVDEASDADQSTFQILIHGFYFRNVDFLGETFRQLRLPGAGALNQRGRPMLPELRLSLAIPTATDTIGATAIQIIQSQTAAGIQMFPAQAEQWDLVPDDTIAPAAPAWDQAFYQQAGPYPATIARQQQRLRDWRGIQVRGAFIYPFRALPGSDELVIHRELRVTFHHPGDPLPPQPVSRRGLGMVTAVLDNVDASTDWIQPETNAFEASYLFLTAPEYVDALEPLAGHKTNLGYEVTILDTDAVGSGCEALRAAVQQWYATSGSPGGDAYVLLVGDHDQLAMCPTGFEGVCEDGDCTEAHYSDFRIGVFSDDLDDIYQDVGVGRLSVDGLADLQQQLTKIIRYENTPPDVRGFWGEALLAAHPEVDTGYIESAEATVAWSGYQYPINFSARYGDQSDGTVAQAIADINSGRSVVAYRGIGSNTGWDAWDFNGQSLTRIDVLGLTNNINTPVVLAIGGGNSGIDKLDDCLGEVWMNGALDGAVAHYGSTRASGTAHNNELLPLFFQLLYTDANPTLWELTTWAQLEARDLAIAGPLTSEVSMAQYQILGLPDLIIYPAAPRPLMVSGLPDTLVGLGPHTVSLDIDFVGGDPLPAAKTSFFAIERKLLYKAEYADSNGHLTTDLTYDDHGIKGVKVTDDFGTALPWDGFIVVVEDVTAAPRASALTATAAPNPFNPRTVIRFQLPLTGPSTVRIFDARGRLVRTLVDADMVAGPNEVAWDGTDARDRELAAGVYFFEVRGGGERVVGKLALIK